MLLGALLAGLGLSLLGDAAVPGLLWLSWTYPQWFWPVLGLAVLLGLPCSGCPQPEDSAAAGLLEQQALLVRSSQHAAQWVQQVVQAWK